MKIYTPIFGFPDANGISDVEMVEVKPNCLYRKGEWVKLEDHQRALKEADSHPMTPRLEGT
jgi:hypothetical protein